MEEKLKLIIHVRKTAHFYKTVVGAGVANVLQSLIAAEHVAEANLFDYLKALQQGSVATL